MFQATMSVDGSRQYQDAAGDIADEENSGENRNGMDTR
jgi:hypothetical protein